MPNPPLPLSLAFELERGGEPELQDEPPTVWRVDEPLRAADLQRRFAVEWMHWYGPVLAPHGAAIGTLLADEAAWAMRLGGLPGTEHPLVWGGSLQMPERSQRFCTVPLPLWWALPVVRKRSRRLRVLLRAIDSAALLQELMPSLAPEWRGQPPRALHLEFETRMYWGAQAEPDHTPGGVRWLPCRVRSDGCAPSVPLAWPAGPAQAESEPFGVTPRPVLERRLRGGIGLQLVLPLLVLEHAPAAAAVTLRQRLQQLPPLQRLARRPPPTQEPGLAARWARDEDWWARELPTARLSPAQLSRALKRGAQLQPASLPALRHAGAGPQTEHVLLLHGQQQSVRTAFAPVLKGAGATIPAQASPVQASLVQASPPLGASAGMLWPGLPLLDEVATWRFEHDPWQGLAASVAVLAAAIIRRIMAPGAAAAATSATGGAGAARLVLVAHGQGGLLARLLLDGWRERWAAQGWRLEAITLGTPHLGQPIQGAQGAQGAQGGERLEGPALPLAPLAGAVDLADWASGPVDRAALVERLRQSRWLAGEAPRGLADLEPQALRRLAGGDLARLPRGMWLLGSVWGALGATGAMGIAGAMGTAGASERLALRPAWLADEPAQSPASSDGSVALASALAGRSPWPSPGGPQAPPEDGVLAFDVSPARHGDYLALPAVRQLLLRGLVHLLGREGSWA